MAHGIEMVGSDPQGKQILVIGDPGRLFLDVDQLDAGRIECCSKAADGIQAAAAQQFALIGLEMRGLAGRLDLILTDLREKSRAKVILLARIDEEPIAIRLVGRSDAGPRADDYVICPTTLQRICRHVQVGDRAVPASLASDTSGELETQIRVLERLATEDDLTGLKNRRYLWEFSRQMLQYAHSRHVRMTLFVYDIDDFKHANDTYGHTVGDTILREIAVLMRRSCRSHDVVGRLGGDEFAVVFWDDPQNCPSTVRSDRRLAKAVHPREAIFMAQRFREAIERSEWRFLGPQGKGVLTISGGLASFPQDGTTIEQLFQKADAALMEAKRGGKNRIYLVGSPPSDVVRM